MKVQTRQRKHQTVCSIRWMNSLSFFSIPLKKLWYKPAPQVRFIRSQAELEAIYGEPQVSA